MTIVPQHEGSMEILSLTMEPVAPQRIQQWAALAGHATTTGELLLVLEAFRAFWWESGASDNFQKAGANWQQGDVRWTIIWLDHTIGRVRQAIQIWEEVMQHMIQEGSSTVSTWFVSDTTERLDMLRSQLTQFQQETVALCTVYGFSLPDSLLEAMGTETIEVIAQPQG